METAELTRRTPAPAAPPKRTSTASPPKLRTRSSWRAKLTDSKDLPKVIHMEGKLSRRWGEGTCVVPAPVEVDALMRKVPSGKIATTDQLRQALARQHGTTIACPLTTGIFAWIAAHAADEGASEGERNTTPYWRTLKAKGELNPKYPGGLAALARQLKAEGHRVVRRGARAFVVDYEQALAKL
jgi:6-O-methylguanine DNA methyltransferase, DNA binding domain